MPRSPGKETSPAARLSPTSVIGEACQQPSRNDHWAEACKPTPSYRTVSCRFSSTCSCATQLWLNSFKVSVRHRDIHVNISACAS